MPYYCTVPRCTSMAGKAKNVSFHQFPRDEELAKLWNNILKRGKPYTKYSKVCSLHFTAEDYTITSVGKNKGQWRTLRKDAIPSQNLPSESPTPYQRKQWGSWTPSPPANALDPTIQQQVAQAIYMQTMLAMQATGATEIPALNHANGLPLPLATEAFPHTSTTSDTDILKGKQTNTDEKSTSYKCTECSKCFKDPDVFILHKRSHIKNEKNEKENFNLNLTLQANPILANLLKTNSVNAANIFDNNMVSVESLLMTALAANMEGYMRNFTSLIKGENRGMIGLDQGVMDHDQDTMDHDQETMDPDQETMDPDRDMIDHDRGELDRDGNDLDHDRDNMYCGHDLSNRSNYDHDNLDLCKKDSQSTSQKRVLDNSSVDSLRGESKPDNHVSYSKDDLIQVSDLIDKGVETNRDNNVFQNRLIEHYRSNKDRKIRYFENDVNKQSLRNGDDFESYDRIMGIDRRKMDNDRDVMDHGRGKTDPVRIRDRSVKDEHDDSQGSKDEPNCDSDFNESVDSNNLVIDENV